MDLKELSAEFEVVEDKNEYEGDVTMKSRLADSDKLSFFPLAIDDYFMAIAVLAKGYYYKAVLAALAVDNLKVSIKFHNILFIPVCNVCRILLELVLCLMSHLV